MCDGDGTLLLPNASDEVSSLRSFLSSSDIKLAVATNGSRRRVIKQFQRAGLEDPDLIVTRGALGVKKPSPEFISTVADKLGVDHSEIVYLGDDDKTDIYAAINAGVLPLAAHYSRANKSLKYGLPINSVSGLENYLRLMAHQTSPYYGWSAKYSDYEVDIRTLLGQHKWIRDSLKRVLKNNKSVRIGPGNIPFTKVLFYFFINQISLSGLIRDMDTVTVYPGSKMGKGNPVLKKFSAVLKRIFRTRWRPDLLLRHKDAKESKKGNRTPLNQLNTVVLNQDHRDAIDGNSVLVIDDFTTSGTSLDAARAMLLQGGASRVVCLAMAKFRRYHRVIYVDGEWSPYDRRQLSADQVATREIRGSLNSGPDNVFKKIIKHYRESK